MVNIFLKISGLFHNDSVCSNLNIEMLLSITFMYCIYTREHFSLSKYDIFRQSWTSLGWLKTLGTQPLPWWHKWLKLVNKSFTSFLTQLHLLITRSSGLKCIELDHKREKCRQVFHFWKSVVVWWLWYEYWISGNPEVGQWQKESNWMFFELKSKFL